MKNESQEKSVGRGFNLSKEKTKHKPVPDNGGPSRELAKEQMVEILKLAAEQTPKLICPQ